MAKIVKLVIFFANGGTGVCNHRGKQIPELQKSWIELFFEWLKEKEGYRVNYKNLEVVMPNGKKAGFTQLEDGTLSWKELSK